MRLKDSEPEPERYFIRASAVEPERGPFSLENLCDLAEFQNLTPEFLVRMERDEAARPFDALPELLAVVFPHKEGFHLKPSEKKEDAEAGFAPIDIHSFYTCDTDESTPLAPPAEAAEGASAGEQSIGFDPRVLLEENEVILKSRKPDEAKPPRRSRLPRSGATIRWMVALGLLGMGFWTWHQALGEGGLGVILIFLVGSFPIALGICLVVSDIIDWGLNRFHLRDCPEPVDSTEADACFAAGDWKGATAAYAVAIKKDPRQSTFYLKGIEAAAAAGDPKKLAAFQAAAIKHLGTHDRNLLTGSLRRRNLPGLPEIKKRPPGAAI